ncbi:MAG: NfeD family protein [Treponema sp.]|nr:NfeD family protein [Treponema sp.]
MQSFLDDIPIQWIWAALVIIFGLIEAFTFNLTTVWFGIAALIVVLLSFFNIPVSIQVVVFFTVSALLLIFTRPLAVKKIKNGKSKTNVDSLLGKNVLILKKADEFETGEAKINGLIWNVKSENNVTIPEGTKCEIIRVEGVHLIVRPLEETE